MAFVDLKKQLDFLEPAVSRAINAVVAAGQFINGPEVQQLEQALSEYVGAEHCVACANGTDALTLPLLAWSIGPGDAVFCPTFTFIATAEVVALRGASCVFVDIDPVTYNIDPESLAERIEFVLKKTSLKPKVVIPVDLFGLPYDYDKISAIAERYGLKILEDAAQGFGGLYGDKRAGSLGDVSATSFFPSKPLACYGDGGAIFTQDRQLAGLLKSIRGHGAGSDRYEHLRLGLNSRLDTLQAAILLVKLAAFPQELQARQKVAKRYEDALRGLVLSVPEIPSSSLSSWAQYTIRVPAQVRDAVVDDVKAKGAPVMVYYPKCLHLQKAFEYLGGHVGQFPAAEKATREVLSLPMHPYLSEQDQDRVVETLKASLKAAGV
ncbi:MAG: DegT/DnrJ/EryC1/StrS family aminotransferase [Deltaproteobacteria bacterium]|nr:DegT/DnrJ/EryC1/StrS family aminotransferase [Deltaproteobacteria bacterium]